MKLLCLSTAEQGCSLAIAHDNALLCEEFWTARQTHSKRLVGMIEHMLDKRAGMALEDIDAFVAAKGPGSFTGLRIGISVIKGLAYAMQKPVAGVSSLDGIAFSFVYASLPVCVMMDARRNEVYCAVFQFNGGRLISKTREYVIRPEKAVEMTTGPTVFAGSGSKAYRAVIEQRAVNPVICHDTLDMVSASAMIRAMGNPESFIHHPENILVPSYIRKSDAELQFVEK